MMCNRVLKGQWKNKVPQEHLETCARGLFTLIDAYRVKI